MIDSAQEYDKSINVTGERNIRRPESLLLSTRLTVKGLMNYSYGQDLKSLLLAMGTCGKSNALFSKGEGAVVCGVKMKVSQDDVIEGELELSLPKQLQKVQNHGVTFGNLELEIDNLAKSQILPWLIKNEGTCLARYLIEHSLWSNLTLMVPKGNSSLFCAVEHSQLDILMLILKSHHHGTLVRELKAVEKRKGHSILHLGVRMRDPGSFRILACLRGLLVDGYCDAGLTPLHAAVLSGDILTVQQLLMLFSIDVNARTKDGLSVLSLFDVEKNQAMLWLLRRYGVSLSDLPSAEKPPCPPILAGYDDVHSTHPKCDICGIDPAHPHCGVLGCEGASARLISGCPLGNFQEEKTSLSLALMQSSEMPSSRTTLISSSLNMMPL